VTLVLPTVSRRRRLHPAAVAIAMPALFGNSVQLASMGNNCWLVLRPHLHWQYCLTITRNGGGDHFSALIAYHWRFQLCAQIYPGGDFGFSFTNGSSYVTVCIAFGTAG